MREEPSPAAYPLLFEPLLKPKVWGGRWLERLGKSLPADTQIGESWEVSDLSADVTAFGRSVIANGDWGGRTLHEALADHGEAIMGAAPLTEEGGFPLLVKYLDARENLSVQVHPSESYIERHPEAFLKSEAWYVVDAAPDAVIYKGLKGSLTLETLRRHIEDGTIVDDLIPVPVRPGDCHYLPSGTCHALGAGVLVAEIQTPSDTTFRLFDWGRSSRDLHLDEAMACIDLDRPAPPEPPPPLPPITRDGITTTPILTTEHFTIEQIDTVGCQEFPVVTNGTPEIWMILAGLVGIQTSGIGTVDVPAGTTTLVPAAVSDAVAVAVDRSRVLRITLPSPLRSMIA
jgi:mannose-6-phosphate isomerase